MARRWWPLTGTSAATAALVVTMGVTAQQASPVASTGEIAARSALPQIGIAELLNGKLGDGTIADDHGIPLGGTGSDLFHASGDPAGEFWMVTDRGPNTDVEVDGEDRLTFPVPGFTPVILRVAEDGAGLKVLDAIPLVGQSGKPVTGISNLKGHDLQPYGIGGKDALPYNTSGLDTEGLVRTADGGFWLADEYGPSLVRVDAKGVVEARYEPQGLNSTGADYPMHGTLPAVYAARRGNRGFEGLAITPDGSTLLAVVQSPLNNPDSDTGKSSRTVRILAVDAATGEPIAEYAYVTDEAKGFDPNPEIGQGDMKLSGIVAVDSDTAIVLERTDDVAKLYTIELAGATNLLGTAWDDAATSPSLEAADLAIAGVAPVAKSLLVDLALPGMPTKIEGVALVDANTVAVANDNDFDIGGLDPATGRWTSTDKPSEILLVTVPGGVPQPDAAPAASPEVTPTA